MIDPAKLTRGKPCHRCGGTLRWKTSRTCVECQRKHARAAQRRYSEAGKHAEVQRRYKERCLEQGLCPNCGKQPLLSESHCWDCLNRKEEQRACSL